MKYCRIAMKLAAANMMTKSHVAAQMDKPQH